MLSYIGDIATGHGMLSNSSLHGPYMIKPSSILLGTGMLGGAPFGCQLET